MKLLNDGKTKTLYDMENGQYRLFFKDDMTGADGVFDPGANTVGLTVDGAGNAGLRLSVYFFRLLTAQGFATHFIDADVDARLMTVRPVTMFGQGLEVVCRYVAAGGFLRRYGAYITEGAPLPAVVEMTLKDDERGDPLINQEALEALGILKPGEHETLAAQTKAISAVLRDELASKGLKLLDIKLEFGRAADGRVLLIDELSGGNMRVTADGRPVPPLELARRVAGA